MRLMLTLLAAATTAQAQSLTAPSGLTIEVGEVRLEEDTGFARFRFIAETLGQTGAEFADVQPDFQWLCETLAVPALAANDFTPDQVIISLGDRLVPFGSSDPDATQYIAGFTTDGESCTEELF